MTITIKAQNDEFVMAHCDYCNDVMPAFDTPEGPFCILCTV